MSLESLDQYLSVCCLYRTYVSALLAAFAQLVHPWFSIYIIFTAYTILLYPRFCVIWLTQNLPRTPYPIRKTPYNGWMSSPLSDRNVCSKEANIALMLPVVPDFAHAVFHSNHQQQDWWRHCIPDGDIWNNLHCSVYNLRLAVAVFLLPWLLSGTKAMTCVQCVAANECWNWAPIMSCFHTCVMTAKSGLAKKNLW